MLKKSPTPGSLMIMKYDYWEMRFPSDTRGHGGPGWGQAVYNGNYSTSITAHLGLKHYRKKPQKQPSEKKPGLLLVRPKINVCCKSESCLTIQIPVGRNQPSETKVCAHLWKASSTPNSWPADRVPCSFERGMQPAGCEFDMLAC